MGHTVIGDEIENVQRVMDAVLGSPASVSA
jgi:hypothetical protein